MESLYTEARILGLNEGRAVETLAFCPGRPEEIGRIIGYAEPGRSDSGPVITHRYRFLVFQLDVLTAERSRANAVLAANGVRSGSLYASFSRSGGPGQWERVDLGGAATGDPKRKLAGKAAVRLVYLAGLDYGLADIGVTSDEQPVVLGLEPFPLLDAEQAGRFAEAVAEYRRGQAAASAVAAPIVLGADPEFLLVNASGKVVQAAAFLPRKGQVGCDLVRIRGKAMFPLAELRPDPSPDPLRLAANVRRALLAAHSMIPDLPEVAWLAGGMPARGFALGGHIHISGVVPDGRLLRALDNYLALPLLMIEDERTKARRPRYGLPGDCRRKAHGGFEYRTLPSWLVSPRVAKGVLALAAVIARRYKRLERRPLDRIEVLRQYVEGRTDELGPLVLPLLGEVRRLPDYAAYEPMLAPLFAMIERKERWEERRDIREAWNIPTLQPQQGNRL